MTGQQPIFENRHDAGKQLAEKLAGYAGKSVVVLAIPNGGVPVGIEVAGALKAELDVIVCRKVPMLLNPEGSLGAATDDGTIIINEEALRAIGLSRQRLEKDISRIRSDIKQRSLLYKGSRPIVRVAARSVIIIDDGLASGYTMMAAVESVRHRHPKEVIAAVPVASAIAFKRLEKVADRVIACTVGYMPKFYVSDFYRHWHDLADSDVLRYLEEWRARRSGSGL